MNRERRHRPHICSFAEANSWVSQEALVVKNLSANAEGLRDVGSISESGRSLGGGHGNSFQYSCLETPMDRGAWWATVHRVAKSQTWLKRLSTHAQGEFLGLSLPQKELCPDFLGVNHPAATLQSWSSMWKHTRLSESSFRNKLAAHIQQASVFPNMLKDDGVKMLHSIWQQIWKTQQWWQE